MQVKIFTADIHESQEAIDKLENSVNQARASHSNTTVQWLQSGSGSPSGKSTNLTAIITYDE